MESILAKVSTEIVLVFFIWIAFFLIIRWSVNKKIVSEKLIEPKTNKFSTDFYNELQIFYHIEKKGDKLFLRTGKIEDLITRGVIIIDAKINQTPHLINITYKRNIKLLGYILILLGIACCYIGVLIPILIVSETKKNALKEVDRIFSILKSI